MAAGAAVSGGQAARAAGAATAQGDARPGQDTTGVQQTQGERAAVGEGREPSDVLQGDAGEGQGSAVTNDRAASACFAVGPNAEAPSAADGMRLPREEPRDEQGEVGHGVEAVGHATAEGHVIGHQQGGQGEAALGGSEDEKDRPEALPFTVTVM